ncbi:OPT/YSL family transporter [Clostridium manihotivorum]|uniref:Oligopeptide transporter, OPT family n=1 Tax=Clostridium manihotivorum TaxID=2320868 RepID=A0A3R5QTZ4_9CLOT|nr:OPT/YSL family transporter [Clostridium manihotivorum]QAA32294.1 hypothetical protein C1I91_11970 [Clostridium manihotivorum]
MKHAIKWGYMVSLGLLIGILYAFIGILLVYKTGMSISSTLVTPIIFYFFIRIFFKPTSEELTLVQIFSSGASLATFSLESAYAASIIYGGNGANIHLWIIMVLGIGMNVFGILIAIPLLRVWIYEEGLPFPKGQAMGNIILSITEDKKENLFQILWCGLIAIVVYITVRLKKSLYNPLASLFKTPDFIGAEISPLLFGLGMFLPFKSVLFMLIGTAYSTLVLVLSNKGFSPAITFKDHLSNPLVLSVAIGLALGYTIYIVPGLLIKIGSVFSNIAKKNTKLNHIYGVCFLVFFLCLSTFIKIQFSFPIYGLIVILCLALLFGLVTARTRGETGLGTTATIYFTIPLIGIITKNITTTLLISGGITLMTVTLSDCMEMMSIGKVTKTSIKKLIICYTIGSVVGVLIGSVTMFILKSEYGFGNSLLPAPTSLTWGTIAKAVVNRGIPTSINIIYIEIAIFLSIILAHFKHSPLLIGMGILIPTSVIIPIFLGGLIAKLLVKNNSKLVPNNVAVGLITGEGIMSIISAVMDVLK